MHQQKRTPQPGRQFTALDYARNLLDYGMRVTGNESNQRICGNFRVREFAALKDVGEKFGSLSTRVEVSVLEQHFNAEQARQEITRFRESLPSMAEFAKSGVPKIRLEFAGRIEGGVLVETAVLIMAEGSGGGASSPLGSMRWFRNEESFFHSFLRGSSIDALLEVAVFKGYHECR
jgi:hypothetical protein